MITLVSGATATERPDDVGHLIVPREWVVNGDRLIPGRWAMDNGAFGGFNEGAFVRMLERFHVYPGCLFVTAPDVVADAAATFAKWSFWAALIRGLRLEPAYVAQDGLNPTLMPDCRAVFIGGSTKFKESHQVRALTAYCNARDIWVHWGRVNGRRRYELALKAGANSIDGSGFSMFPDTNIPKIAEWRRDIARQPELGL